MSSQNPLAYTGVRAPNPPNVVKAHRAPTANDVHYDVDTMWLDQLHSVMYQLVAITAGAANWQALATGAQLTTLTTDNSSTATAAAGNVNILSGTGIITSAAGSTVTISADVSRTEISTFNTNPILESALSTGAAPTGATGDTNVMMLQGGVVMEQFIIGAGQTIIAPRMDANGLLVSLDLTATEGAEYNWGLLASSKHAYSIGTSPAFQFALKFRVADVSGATPILMGFRKLAAANGTYTNYTDYAAIGLNNGVNPGTVIIEDRLNTGVAVQTNTTDVWADGESHTLTVKVTAGGVVTYLIDGVAPTVTHALTFDNGDVVVPFFYITHGAAAPGKIQWVGSLTVGPQ